MLESNKKYLIHLNYKLSICQTPSEMMLKSPVLIISMKLIITNFEYALKSVNRPNPTTILHTNRSQHKHVGDEGTCC